MAGDIQTTSGSKFWISDGATAATTDTLAEYEALTWVEVGMIEDLGSVGDVSTEVTGASIGDGRVRKAKGARNAGTMNIICFHDWTDVGQLALIEAEGTNDNYAFKIELADGPPSPGTNSFQYFRGLVMSKEMRLGTNDNIMRRAFNVGVNSPIIEDIATVGALRAGASGETGDQSTTSTTQTPKEPVRADAR